MLPLANRPLKAFLLDGGSNLKAEAVGNTIVVPLPAALPDADATVVALEIEGAPRL